MRLAVLMKKADYENAEITNVQILGVEIVDITKYTTNVSDDIEYVDAVTSTEYIKHHVNVKEDAFKRTIINNYSDCVYNKTNDEIVPTYQMPNNRAITEMDQKYPMMVDQFLGTTVL